MDFVFTVCDDAAGEMCPVWPGQPITAHWGVPVPAAATGTEVERMTVFRQVFGMLQRRIQVFAALPFAALDRIALTRRVQEIGQLREYRRNQRRVDECHAMNLFERFLTLWVALCIVAGIALGQIVPGVFHVLGAATVAQVNLPVAVLVWLMIVPMLLKIDLRRARPGRRTLARHRNHGRRQLAGQAVLDGAARLALHRASVPALAAGGPDRQLHRRADPARGGTLHGHGVRLVEPRRWRAAFHALSQVALNDTIMVVAFAPIVALLLGLSSITVPWDTLFLRSCSTSSCR